ncbi:TerD family protein [Streptomyces sp. TRM70350]|uniref:TerD family protein n=1 Tax=Streptomyces sp. TRM70350 TaxID=2856165 RepID=UPI0027E1612D|nr:TerD family protein [Streptomyces sp. TRM70350]
MDTGRLPPQFSVDRGIALRLPPADPDIRAMVVAELYRHTIDGRPAWKLRALGQGWADGLDGLARAHGVDVE